MKAMATELERLYEQHAQALFAFLLNFTRDEQDTRDLLQDIFVRLARNPELLSGTSSPRGFLLRMAHNAAVDLIRRRGTRDKYHESYQLEEISPFAATSDPDEATFRTELAAGLGQLPPEQRAVVHLKLWEGLTFAEIAAALDIPSDTAASRYRYGIDKLRSLLRPLYDELDEH